MVTYLLSGKWILLRIERLVTTKYLLLKQQIIVISFQAYWRFCAIALAINAGSGHKPKPHSQDTLVQWKIACSFIKSCFLG